MKCAECGNEKTVKDRSSLRCLVCGNKRVKDWRQKHPETVVKKNLTYKKNNRAKTLLKDRERRTRLRQILFNHYGNKCACCGESEITFLCFDHIHNDGSEDRKKYGSGATFYLHLINDNFPKGIRVLCQNCNFCIWTYGQCIHIGPPIKTGGPRYEYAKQNRFKTRLLILKHYSNGDPKCACCSIKQIEFLSVDHLKGGGGKHKRLVGKRGTDFYKWIIDNDFPPLFQVLCHNCNTGKGTSIMCPHQTIVRE